MNTIQKIVLPFYSVIIKFNSESNPFDAYSSL